MELRTYLTILGRRKWVIIITVVVTLATVLLGTFTMKPVYAASITLRIATAAGATLNYTNIQYADRLLNTYGAIATSGPVMDELVQSLLISKPPEIEVEAVPNTELLVITVEHHSAEMAAMIANTLGEILIERSRQLYTGGGKSPQEILGEQLAQTEDELNRARAAYDKLLAEKSLDIEGIEAAGRSVSLKEETYAMLLAQYEEARIREALQANTLSVVEPAVVPESHSKPREVVNIVLGLVVGLVGGAGLAFVFENLDTTLYDTEQIETISALPSLGNIPTINKQPRVKEEAFRRLRTSLFALDGGETLRTLLVTSTETGEGKTTILVNLADALAKIQRNVVVVDADFRNPTLHKYLKLSNKIGLSDTLRLGTSPDKATMHNDIIPGVKVITSGLVPPNPTELLASPQMKNVMRQLAQSYDMVLLDTPSIVEVADAAVLAQVVDAVILVAGRAQVREDALRTAHRHLADVKAKTIGLVINRVELNGSHLW